MQLALMGGEVLSLTPPSFLSLLPGSPWDDLNIRTPSCLLRWLGDRLLTPVWMEG